MTNITPGNTRKATTPISPIDSIREQLLLLKPTPTHGKEQAFAGLYPDIQRLIAEKVTQRDILAVLANHGVKLSPTRFKELLRKYSGEPPCDTSGTPLTPRSATKAAKSPLQGASAFQRGDLPVSAASFPGLTQDELGEDRA